MSNEEILRPNFLKKEPMELQAIFLPTFTITIFTYSNCRELPCPKSLIYFVESECWLDLANLVNNKFIFTKGNLSNHVQDLKFDFIKKSTKVKSITLSLLRDCILEAQPLAKAFINVNYNNL